MFLWNAITVTVHYRSRILRTVHVFMTLKSHCIILTSRTKTNWHPTYQLSCELLQPQTRVAMDIVWPWLSCGTKCPTLQKRGLLLLLFLPYYVAFPRNSNFCPLFSLLSCYKTCLHKRQYNVANLRQGHGWEGIYVNLMVHTAKCVLGAV